VLSFSIIRDVGPLNWITRNCIYQFRKRILGRETSFRLPTGATITLSGHKGNGVLYLTQGNIDWGSEAILARFADGGRDFLDIGSHIGYYAAYLAPRVRRVYAFEPNPSNLPALYKNAQLATNIQVVEMAASSRDGEANFFCGRNSSVSSLNSVGGRVLKVAVTTVDTFVRNNPGIDVSQIKIDVEGHDLEVLHGMDATIRTFQPLILTECEWSERLTDLCSQWEYSVFAFTRDRKTKKLTFRELRGNDAAKYWCKMLFLVPLCLRTAFSDLTDN